MYERTGNAQIRGVKWDDVNGNGIRDAGEVALAGWAIYLDQNQNAQLDADETKAIADANGNYTFTGLAAGSYTVRSLSQSGWKDTFPNTTPSNTLIPVTDCQDLIFDQKRNLLYITTSSGDVQRYDIAALPYLVG